jgi:hypothetical protein
METRFCIFCDRQVEKLPKATKEWTTGGAAQGDYKHIGAGPSCGRQFLFEHETYTETDIQS